MRLLIAALLLCIALPVAAQTKQNSNLQPVPEPPPPPAGMELDPSLEPQVTIIKRGSDTVEEYRVSGKLYMLKVTPPSGLRYDRRERRRQVRPAGTPGQRHPSADVGDSPVLTAVNGE